MMTETHAQRQTARAVNALNNAKREGWARARALALTRGNLDVDLLLRVAAQMPGCGVRRVSGEDVVVFYANGVKRPRHLKLPRVDAPRRYDEVDEAP
jgi:hypothetical protein